MEFPKELKNSRVLPKINKLNWSTKIMQDH